MALLAAFAVRRLGAHQTLLAPRVGATDGIAGRSELPAYIVAAFVSHLTWIRRDARAHSPLLAVWLPLTHHETACGQRTAVPAEQLAPLADDVS